MHYLPLSDAASRQLIDSTTIFNEYVRVKALARGFAGGMYWKQQGEYQYLVKTLPDNRQQVIGRRGPQTELAYEKFTGGKHEIESRLKSLHSELISAQRLNKAVRAGRVPPMVVSVLQAIEDAGLGEHFVVVGTHALYAYETAAGVRIVPGALATQDVNLLWNARRRVQFTTDLAKLDTSVLAILQRVDKSFERKAEQSFTAINEKGFEVDFLRRQPEGEDPHPFQISTKGDDLCPVQARRAGVLTNAPRFEHVVVSTTGRMALMRTVSPGVFVDFKTWLAQHAPEREPLKRRRDLHQAQIVQALLAEKLLLLP
jgi:hypothetical protein